MQEVVWEWITIRERNEPMRCVFLAVLIFILSSTVASAGPFGFDINTHPKEYGYCRPAKDKPKAWYCGEAPRQHSAFEQYGLWFVEGVGICKIQAVGKSIKNDPYAYKLLKEMARVERHVSYKYGEGKKYDHLKSDSIYRHPEPKNRKKWMSQMRRGLRDYGYRWSKEVDKVRKLDLFAVVEKKHSYLIIHFELVTDFDCMRKLADKDSKAF